MPTETSTLHARLAGQLKAQATDTGLAADPLAYDAWFRSKVQEAQTDPCPATPHSQVMQKAQRLIDGKRQA